MSPRCSRIYFHPKNYMRGFCSGTMTDKAQILLQERSGYSCRKCCRRTSSNFHLESRPPLLTATSLRACPSQDSPHVATEQAGVKWPGRFSQCGSWWAELTARLPAVAEALLGLRYSPSSSSAPLCFHCFSFTDVHSWGRSCSPNSVSASASEAIKRWQGLIAYGEVFRFWFCFF